MNLSPGCGRPPRVNEIVVYHAAAGVRGLARIVEDLGGGRLALELLRDAGGAFVPTASHGFVAGRWSHVGESPAPATDPGRRSDGGRPGPSGGPASGGHRR